MTFGRAEQDHGGTTPAASLITPFNFPCGINFYDFQGRNNEYFKSNCAPPNFNSYWDSSLGYYSPAICPEGYTVGCRRWDENQGPTVEPTETAMQCVPTGFTCGNNPSFAESATKRAVMIQIRWAETDLSALATHPLVPNAKATAHVKVPWHLRDTRVTEAPIQTAAPQLRILSPEEQIMADKLADFEVNVVIERDDISASDFGASSFSNPPLSTSKPTSTPTAPPSGPSSQPLSPSLSGGAIAGIVISAVLGMALVFLLFWQRRRSAVVASAEINNTEAAHEFPDWDTRFRHRPELDVEHSEPYRAEMEGSPVVSELATHSDPYGAEARSNGQPTRGLGLPAKYYA